MTAVIVIYFFQLGGELEMYSSEDSQKTEELCTHTASCIVLRFKAFWGCSPAFGDKPLNF